MATLTYPEVAEYYAAVQIQTASKPRAICMLHEKCVQFISAALDSPPERNVFVIKAQNILAQLERSLIREDSISQSLFYLYDYCFVILHRGTDEDLTNAGEILAILRDTFQLLARRPR
jgi:flagellar biosynthetic protein FliS